MAACEFTPSAPFLDGVLDDACWTGATPAQLSQRAPQDGYIGFTDSTPIYEDARPQVTDDHPPEARFAWDSNYLYVAISSPIRDGQPIADTQLAGRTHDAQLREHDRWMLCLDVDRDYSTWYELMIDQRGCTHDRCWGDDSWNPLWHVAPRRDADRWLVEAAIPWSELVARPPQPGEVWNLGMLRITPSVGTESWTFPHAETPLPQGLGLLRFTSAATR